MNIRSISNAGLILLALSLSACGGSSSSGSTGNANISPNHPEFFRNKATLQASYYPTGDINETMPTFSWRAIPNATEYHFGHEATEDSSEWLEYSTSASDAGCPNTGDMCEHTPSDYTFPLDVKKVWWVQAKVNGTWQDWSDPILFTVVGGNNTGGVPTPVAPIGDIHTTSPEFSWTSVNGASSYMLGSEDANTSEGWQQYELSISDANCQTAQTCTYTPSNPNYSIDQDIAWWVRAKVNGTWQNWSETGSFTVVDNNTGSGTATPVQPAGNINTTNPEFSWTSVNGASDYKLAYEDADTSEGWEQHEMTSADASCQTSQTCRFTPANSNFSVGQIIAWWVKAKVNGEWSDWSETGRFSILPAQNIQPLVLKVDPYQLKCYSQNGNRVCNEVNNFDILTKGTGYNFTVDCNGDGIPEGTGLTSRFTCSYPARGKYQVTISGIFPQIYHLIPNKTRGEQLGSVEVVQWGSTKWRSMKAAFLGSENLTISATDIPDLSNVKSMNNMFANTSTHSNSPPLNINNIEAWDVSNVTDMASMFTSSNFNQDISNWDVSNVTDMTFMFSFSSFNQNISNWNVSNVIGMHGLFRNAHSFDQDISNWNVSNVTDMSSMFESSNFNQDISNWNVSFVQNMQSMFRNTTRFNQDLSNWKVSHVTSMSHMFSKSIFNYNIENWDVSNVTNMLGMFSQATAFNQPVNNWDTSNVTRMSVMFKGATAFNQPINNWDVSKVTRMSQTFNGATAFNQPIDNWDVSNITSMSRMFNGTNLDSNNYDRLLKGWSVLNLQTGVSLDVGNTKYSQSAATARDRLLHTFNWTINDGGEL